MGSLLQKLFEIRRDMAAVTKDRKGYNYKYADLGACHEVLDPLLEHHHILWVTEPHCTPDGRAGVKYRIIDLDSEDCIDGDLLLPMADLDPQKAGSAITYARRYALGVFGLRTEEDDDGAAASKKRKRANPKAEAAKVLTEEQMSELVSLCQQAAHERFPDNAELEAKDFKSIGQALVKYMGVPKFGSIPREKFDTCKTWISERKFES